MSQIPFIRVEDDEHDVVTDLNADNNAAAPLENAALWPGGVDGFNLQLPDLNLPATEMDTSSVPTVQNNHSGPRILDGSDPYSSFESIVQNLHSRYRILDGSEPDSSVHGGDEVGSVINLFGQRIELSGSDPDSEPVSGDEVVPRDDEDVVGSMFRRLGNDWERFLRQRDEDEAVSDDNEDEIQGGPPASKASVENLDSVVISEDGNEDCGVCKEMSVGETVKQLPCCHRYHGDCILPWLHIRNTCPVCRYELPTHESSS